MVLVVEAIGVGKVGAVTAQLPGFPVHVGHEILHGSVHRLGQDVAGVAVRLQQHTVEQLLNGDGFPGLEAADDIFDGDVLYRRLVHRDHRVRGELAVLNGLHHQQGGHHLGDAGGVGPLVGPHVVEDLAVVGVQQHRIGAEEIQILLAGGGDGGQQGQRHGDEEKQREKRIFFHRKISVCML